jgi:predicted RNA-binding Zn ribbon-like protein
VKNRLKPASGPGAGVPSGLPTNWANHSCLDLVNSQWMDHLGSGVRFDRLPLPEFQRWLLERWGWEVQLPLRKANLQNLARLRVLVRRVLVAWAESRPPRARDHLDLLGYLRGAALHRDISSLGAPVRLIPVKRDANWVAAELAASCAELIATGEPGRLKTCANESCSWMFYDDSASQSRRWCEPKICGNLVKVRNFRRKRDSRPPADSLRGASAASSRGQPLP